MVKASSSYGGRPRFDSVGSHFFLVVPKNSLKLSVSRVEAYGDAGGYL